MAYSIVRVVTADWSDGRLYPVMADPATAGGMLVESEDLDGPSVITVPVSLIRVSEVTAGGSMRQQEYKDVKATLYVTDSRAVIACENYDQGSTYLGFGDIAAPISLAATAVSRLRARARRKGTLLTGQIRYQWLSAVRAAPRNGVRYPNRLRLVCSTYDDNDGRRPYVLELSLSDHVRSSLDVALEIIHRAAEFKLRWYDEMSEETRAELEKLAVAPPLERPEKGKVCGHSIPYYLYVRASTAVPNKYAGQRQQPPGRA